MSLYVFSHPYFCWNTYKQAGYSCLGRILLPNMLNYVTGWGVHCLLHKNQFFCHLSGWIGLLLFCLCVCDTWGGEGGVKSIACTTFSLSLSFRTDELKFLTLNTKEISSIIFKSLKCLENYPQIIDLLIHMSQAIHMKDSIKCYFTSAMNSLFYFWFEVSVEIILDFFLKHD